jgi:hypothetical protein
MRLESSNTTPVVNPTSPTDAAIAAINSTTPDLGAVEPRLSSLTFAELDGLIDHELRRNKDVLLPYLREMHSRFEGVQGERNDLHPDTPTMGWQAWVRSKKEKIGVSLSTANRLLAADREPKPKKKTVEPEAASMSLTPVQQDVVQALVAQGFTQEDALACTTQAAGGDFDTLFRAAVTGTKSDATIPPPHGQAVESTPDPQIAELRKQLELAKAENVSLRQRLEALSSVPDHLRDGSITATLASEPDRDKASDMLRQYFVTIAQRILPTHMALNTADALLRIHVLFAGRDHRIMIGDWLEKKGVGDHPPTLCKCTAIADYMQRRRVREWADGEWGKECVVYSGDETGYRVITKEAARKLAPAAFGPQPDPPSSSKVEQEVPEGEGTAAAVTVIGDDEPKIGDKGGRTDQYYWEMVKSETLPFLIRTVIDDQAVKQCKSKAKAEAAISLYETNLASTGSIGSEAQPQETGEAETYEDRGADGADRRPVVS